MELKNPLKALNHFLQISQEPGLGGSGGGFTSVDNNSGELRANEFSYNATSSALHDPGGTFLRRVSENLSFVEDEINSSFHSPEISIIPFGASGLPGISKEPKTMVTTTVGFWPLGFGLLILCTLGLVGNILSAIVLARPKMKSTYSILTLGLTLMDTVYLFTKFLRYGILSLFVHFSLAYSYTEIFYPIFGPYLRALTFTAHTGSTYFTVALAVDRYISVCWPVQARILCTKRRAHTLVMSVFLFSILYNVPRWMEFHTETKVVFDDTLDTNVTIYSMEISNLRKDPMYKSLYIFWGYFILIFFIPFTSLTFFNYKIFRVVRESNKAREKLTSYQKREISFAMMLISIVAVFLICSTDYLVLDLLTYFKQPYSSFWDELGNFLLTVNSAVNFLIYCAFGRKFRQEFFQATREIFWNRKRSEKTISSRIMSGSHSAGRVIKQDGGSSDSSKSQRSGRNNGCQCQCK